MPKTISIETHIGWLTLPYNAGRLANSVLTNDIESINSPEDKFTAYHLARGIREMVIPAHIRSYREKAEALYVYLREKAPPCTLSSENFDVVVADFTYNIFHRYGYNDCNVIGAHEALEAAKQLACMLAE